MTDLIPPFLAALGTLIGGASLLWLVSLRLSDVSIVDIAWGLMFVVAAWVYRLMGPEAEARQLLLLALVTIWGVRLAAYIFWRSRGKSEDYRYAKMREDQGPSFRWTSLFTVFWLQATLAALISAPFLVAESRPVAPGWRWTDFLGAGLWAIGFFFEAVGDWQMARFKANPDNKGKVLDSGLWALTRHPNYFGDAMVWWGFWVISLGAPGGWWTFPAPIIMTILLLKVSGVALLEKTITERRPKYRDYIERTSAFFPWPPKKSSSASSAS